ncbi:translation initiation factor IF-3, mitochondrial-like [Amphiura filiformis]|uniref:translation initiation factor IF-3, mitochondrial-like n=1 Tax=Amphiura filiformis TaxID=82378 RepID=UPI003B218A67
MSQGIPASIRFIHKIVGRSTHSVQRRASAHSTCSSVPVITSSYCTAVKRAHISPLLYENSSSRYEKDSVKLPFLIRQSACFHSSNLHNAQKHDRAENIELDPHDNHRIDVAAEKLKRSVPHKVVELLDENNVALGSMPRDEAIGLSESKKVKLVMVNPSTRPYPTYRLISKEDFQKEQMQIKERLKKDVKTSVKEVRLACGIAEHDLAVKRRQINEWFEDSRHEYHVKITVKGGKSWKPITEDDQIALVHSLLSGMEDRITFNNKPKSFGNKDNPSLTVTLRKMSVKEKAAYNKQKNIEEQENLE